MTTDDDARNIWRNRPPGRLGALAAINQITAPPQLHPDSWRDLRQLAKLHGTRALIEALQYLAQTERL